METAFNRKGKSPNTVRFRVFRSEMYSRVVRPIPDLIHLNGFGVEGAELGLSRHWSPRGLVLPYSYRNFHDHRTVVLTVDRDWLVGQDCSKMIGQTAVQDTVRYGTV